MGEGEGLESTSEKQLVKKADSTKMTDHVIVYAKPRTHIASG